MDAGAGEAEKDAELWRRLRVDSLAGLRVCE